MKQYFQTIKTEDSTPEEDVSANEMNDVANRVMELMDSIEPNPALAIGALHSCAAFIFITHLNLFPDFDYMSCVEITFRNVQEGITNKNIEETR